jgi:hypothetical protein
MMDIKDNFGRQIISDQKHYETLASSLSPKPVKTRSEPILRN